jgi:copper chaperone NosL
VIAVMALLSACGSHSPRPVDIDPSDMCGYCRMAISQRQFAAEVLDAEDNPTKFDDIGCLLRYLTDARHKSSAVFVVDYETRAWIDAAKASFVRGSRVTTPMAGGILAFGERARAETAARAVGGEILPFARLGRP